METWVIAAVLVFGTGDMQKFKYHQQFENKAQCESYIPKVRDTFLEMAKMRFTNVSHVGFRCENRPELNPKGQKV